jgi:hypothetical protein
MAKMSKKEMMKKAKKSVKSGGFGLFGNAARGMMGRKKRLESMIQGKAKRTRKRTYG